MSDRSDPIRRAASGGQPRPGADARERFRAGMRAGMAFVIPTLAIGISFGVLARSLGWGVAAPIAASAFVYSASAQFAVASVLGAGGSGVAAIVAAVLANARFLPMGLAIAPALRGGRLRRALEGQASVDTSWALANRGDGRFDREGLIGATIPQYVAWLVGTVIGVVGSEAIGDPEALGLDALFPAFFLALLVSEVDTPRARVVVVLAAALALALLPWAPPGVPVVAACVTALLGLRVAR